MLFDILKYMFLIISIYKIIKADGLFFFGKEFNKVFFIENFIIILVYVLNIYINILKCVKHNW